MTHRYNILDHLAEMSGNLRQWDMEKDLQNCLATEVKKLKEQLRIAEEKLQVQRERVNSMGPKVSTAREKINIGRHECFKLSRICSTLGNRLLGKKYKYASIKAIHLICNNHLVFLLYVISYIRIIHFFFSVPSYRMEHILTGLDSYMCITKRYIISHGKIVAAVDFHRRAIESVYCLR